MLLNRKKVKQFALECAKDRHHKFTRVSQDFLIYLDVTLREKIKNHIHSIPSVGKTIS